MIDSIDPEILANTTAVLATINRDGSPQLTAVWFAVRDGHLQMSINRNRHKVRNLQANPQCSVLIYHPQTDAYFVEIRGTATLIDDDEYAIADVIGARYNADFRAFDQPGDGRVVIDLAPTKVLVTDVRH